MWEMVLVAATAGGGLSDRTRASPAQSARECFRVKFRTYGSPQAKSHKYEGKTAQLVFVENTSHKTKLVNSVWVAGWFSSDNGDAEQW